MKIPNHLGAKIKLISNTMEQNLTRDITSLDLTCSQAFILRYLSLHQGEVVYSKNLETSFDFSHPTISGLLQRLEAKGFIACSPDPDDRRFKRIELTDKARQCHESIVSSMRHADEMLMDGFTEEETHTLFSLLDRLIENATNAGMQKGGCQHGPTTCRLYPRV